MSAVHSDIGASSYYRWKKCPGSVRLIQEVSPPRRETTSSKQGHATHHIAELAFRNRLPPQVYLFAKFKEIPDVIVDLPMVNGAAAYVKYLEENGALDPRNTVFLEEKVTFTKDGKGFGTLDAGIYTPADRHLLIVDFKFGIHHEVAAVGNDQIKCYTVGTLQKFPDAEHFTAAIVQPRNGGIKIWEFNRATADTFAPEIEADYRATKKKNAPLRAGGHCGFCPAKIHCPAFQKHVVAEACIEFNEYLLKLPSLENDGTIPLHRILDSAELIRGWLNEVEDFARRRVLAGGKVEGYKIAKALGKRRWKDEHGIQSLFEQVSPSTLFKRTPLSPAQVEELAKADDSVGRNMHIIETMWHREASPILVRHSDDREPWNDPLTEFSEFANYQP